MSAQSSNFTQTLQKSYLESGLESKKLMDGEYLSPGIERLIIKELAKPDVICPVDGGYHIKSNIELARDALLFIHDLYQKRAAQPPQDALRKNPSKSQTLRERLLSEDFYDSVVQTISVEIEPLNINSGDTEEYTQVQVASRDSWRFTFGMAKIYDELRISPDLRVALDRVIRGRFVTSPEEAVEVRKVEKNQDTVTFPEQPPSFPEGSVRRRMWDILKTTHEKIPIGQNSNLNMLLQWCMKEDCIVDASDRTNILNGLKKLSLKNFDVTPELLGLLREEMKKGSPKPSITQSRSPLTLKESNKGGHRWVTDEPDDAAISEALAEALNPTGHKDISR